LWCATVAAKRLRIFISMILAIAARKLHGRIEGQCARIAPATGDSVRKIAARFGIDPSTVQRIARPFADAAA
jgi:phosphopantothenoylcysteine synthetase/decarboxylase